MGANIQSTTIAFFNNVSFLIIAIYAIGYPIVYFIAALHHPEGFSRVLLFSEVFDQEPMRTFNIFASTNYSINLVVNIIFKFLHSLYHIESYRGQTEKYKLFYYFSYFNFFCGFILSMANLGVCNFPVSQYRTFHLFCAYIMFFSGTVFMISQYLFDKIVNSIDKETAILRKRLICFNVLGYLCPVFLFGLAQPYVGWASFFEHVGVLSMTVYFASYVKEMKKCAMVLIETKRVD
ncbi:hypothetical protein CYY_005778 [Polysphondylium violaceum]|uniref:CWH43-like N-terminal domain-containing protein n=1 Tax=Polysphondylium violaceum TaxID=133409 RepID=A0A8J4PTA7_9MYCE|nr:hypothetical protein CYY_005778 [Polysphondylium violaceum]